MKSTNGLDANVADQSHNDANKSGYETVNSNDDTTLSKVPDVADERCEQHKPCVLCIRSRCDLVKERTKPQGLEMNTGTNDSEKRRRPESEEH